jgi:hypothetical protein
MDEWLLTYVPTWLLTLLAIGSTISLAIAAMWLVRPAVQAAMQGHHNEVAGYIFAVVGVLYGVLLGFLVIAEWQVYHDAAVATNQEAGTLGALYRETVALPRLMRKDAQQALCDYARNVVETELPSMQAAERMQFTAASPIHHVFVVYTRLSPSDALYPSSFELLGSLEERRNKRFSSDEAAMPGLFWLVLLLGGAITIGFCVLFYMENRFIQTVLVAATSAMIASSLMLVLVLSHPFMGATKISTPDLLTKVASCPAP